MAKTAGGTDTDRFDGVTTNGMGEIFVSAIVRGNSNFDAIQHIVSDQSKFYPVLAKINNSSLNTSPIDNETSILYPNPTADYFYIQNSHTNSKG